MKIPVALFIILFVLLTLGFSACKKNPTPTGPGPFMDTTAAGYWHVHDSGEGFQYVTMTFYDSTNYRFVGRGNLVQLGVGFFPYRDLPDGQYTASIDTGRDKLSLVIENYESEDANDGTITVSRSNGKITIKGTNVRVTNTDYGDTSSVTFRITEQ